MKKIIFIAILLLTLQNVFAQYSQTRTRYETADPKFLDSPIYMPDFELMQQTLSAKSLQHQQIVENDNRIIEQISAFIIQEEYDKAIDLASYIQLPISKFSTMARLYKDKGDIISAYNYTYKCLSYRVSENDIQKINNEINTLSGAINVKFNKAIQNGDFNKALWMGRNIENKVFSYTLQGWAYYVQQDFENAKRFFKAIKKQSKHAKEMIKKIKKEEKEQRKNK